MKANETKVETFLSSNKTQFIIPVYQRNYDWNIQQCHQIWKDILEVGVKNEMNAHFIGSIVYIHDDVYTSSRIKELTIIDGQQRLTTLTLIYLALYQFTKELGDNDLANEISETYLINKFASDDEKLKLKPTDNNNKALKYLLRADSSEEFLDFSRLIDNFNYFKKMINQENYLIILDGLSKLMFVEISLERGKDDPQRIFESLNSTGLELSQADLIRNYILMGLNYENQNKIYNNYWEIIERFAQVGHESRVSDFIRDYLTLINKRIPTKSKVYVEFKNQFPTSDLKTLEENLSPIKSLVKFYNRLLNPNNEPDKDIRRQLEYINRIEVNVAYPFLMKVYEDYANNIIDKKVFIEILELVQSFVWRRFIVGTPTNGLNKIFMTCYEQIDLKNYLYSFQKFLLEKKGIQRFPRDKEVKESLKFKDVYNIKSKNRTYLLERLENFENKEPVIIENNPEITIEHIFPQNPDSQWKKDLSEEDYNELKETYMNTIGNLTLSGNNGKLGNKSFKDKRDKDDVGYKDSRLWLNRYLATLGKWDLEEIEKRFEVLSYRFFNIWRIPSIEFDLISEEKMRSDEVNIFDAEDPRNKKLAYAIFLDKKLEVNQVSKLYSEIFKQLFELNPENFFITDLAKKISLTKTVNGEKLRQPIVLNDTYVIEGNLDNNSKFKRIKDALIIFDLQDELLIKYAE
ncbi:DUF262 domain-containing protein [Gallibacterium salpingitidis]|uniref:DUF262 domain-containing protein n=1 Tax=Gallibacterium salpingitidis TaxID=505341 RepID=A0A1A7P1K9_9PAST|nr:DUF262 domain-containing protein [Gallibacterium salpingitidis]OBW95868.1 hypothetical protein QS62_02135 [Gallibacterium salpingitidis]